LYKYKCKCKGNSEEKDVAQNDEIDEEGEDDRFNDHLGTLYSSLYHQRFAT
jgi:hypothetical protein